MALSGLQIVNTIVRLIATAHLTYGSYSMYYAVIPSHILPIDPAFCGKLKYLTFWNVCLETLYFWFALIDSLVSGCSENEKKPLRKIRDHYFLSVVFPLSWFVAFTFWALFAIDRELVMPKAVDAFFPMWLNHTVHTSIVVYSVLELITSYHKCTSTIYKQCYALWSVTLIYVIWCHIVFYMTDMWVYPILNELNFFCRLLFFAGCFVLATTFLAIGFYVNNTFWKRRIQDESKAKSFKQKKVK